MNIYLGNLNFKVKAEDLTALVQQYGSVANARIITDRETGRSRGFGFVEMDGRGFGCHRSPKRTGVYGT